MSKRPSVLIVESRPNTRTFLEMTLNQAGVRVFSAVSLESALLQLRVWQPDLIIVSLDRHAFSDGLVVAQIRSLTRAPLLALADECDGSSWPGIAGTLSYPIKVGQLRSKVAGLLSAL